MEKIVSIIYKDKREREKERERFISQSIGEIMREKIPIVTIKINIVKFIMPNYIHLNYF